MFFYLLLLMTLMPMAELIVLLQFHGVMSALTGPGMGLILTIITVLGAGAVGAALARHQGLRTLAAVQESLARGQMPTDALIDGALILAGGLMLLTPGFISDLIGLSLLIPPTRALYRAYVRGWIKRQFEQGRVFVKASGSFWFSSAGFSTDGFTFPGNIKRINPDPPTLGTPQTPGTLGTPQTGAPADDSAPKV